jgi:hypothetical protein
MYTAYICSAYYSHVCLGRHFLPTWSLAEMNLFSKHFYLGPMGSSVVVQYVFTVAFVGTKLFTNQFRQFTLVDNQFRLLEFIQVQLSSPFSQKSRSPLYIAKLMVLIYWLGKTDPSHLIGTNDVVYIVRWPRFLYQIYQ